MRRQKTKQFQTKKNKSHENARIETKPSRHQNQPRPFGFIGKGRERITDLLADNQELIKYLRATHEVCDQHNDVATASLIENWIDETESRAWFLYETINRA